MQNAINQHTKDLARMYANIFVSLGSPPEPPAKINAPIAPNHMKLVRYFVARSAHKKTIELGKVKFGK